MNPLAFLLSLMICLLAASHLHATDHFVATAKQLDAAINAAKAGDTITLRNGTWRDIEILFQGVGTASHPITLRAEQSGKVVLTGRSRLRIAGDYLIVDGLFFDRAFHTDDLIAFRRDSKRLASHCRLTNCALVDCNSPDGKSTNRWISLYGDHHRVDHCWLQGKSNEGATLVVWLTGTPNEHRIDHNYFGPRPELKKNGGETIRIGDSKTSLSNSRTVVELNRFEQCNGEAEIISNKSCENIYRANVFVRCSGALTLRHGHRCVVEGNLFLGEGARGSGGVRIIGEEHRVYNNYFADLAGDDARAAISVMNGLRDSPLEGYSTVKRAVIAFNTMVNCKQNLLIGLGNEDARNLEAPRDCTVANNLLIVKNARPAVEFRVTPIRLRSTGNLVNGEKDAMHEGFRHAAVKMVQDKHKVWRPSTEDPVLEAADNFDFVDQDMDAQPRGAHKHIGCDQVAPGLAVPVPLSATTGPAWRS